MNTENQTNGSHPAAEEWMDFIYGELPRGRRAELEKHLEKCAECQGQVGVWNQARQALDQWPLPRSAMARRRPSFAWAAAAAALLLVGFVAGRALPTARYTEKLKREIAASLRQSLAGQLDGEMRQALTNQWAGRAIRPAPEPTGQFVSARQLAEALDRSAAANRAEIADLLNGAETARLRDHELFSAALQRLEQKQIANYAALRKELETVAFMTERSLSRAQEQIVELAVFNQQENRPGPDLNKKGNN